MKRLVLCLAAVALVACADSAPHRTTAPQRASRDLTCKSGYMVAYNSSTGQYDTTCVGQQ